MIYRPVGPDVIGVVHIWWDCWVCHCPSLSSKLDVWWRLSLVERWNGKRHTFSRWKQYLHVCLDWVDRWKASAFKLKKCMSTKTPVSKRKASWFNSKHLRCCLLVTDLNHGRTSVSGSIEEEDAIERLDTSRALLQHQTQQGHHFCLCSFGVGSFLGSKS